LDPGLLNFENPCSKISVFDELKTKTVTVVLTNVLILRMRKLFINWLSR